ncbi:hypothetical protein L227DRAFT_392334 [Lentinus tigrinus ALCF2SS1-6]|uniref:Uncharacterized protein n=1 Tax=Lentinus tigrinus ALCF2SS1-6 TaxID=1328759 RepID=A0A5C2SJT6_9APHY|nr:hypothetical protein L227DRAFT_392334 [Lentinus tigrinus ALCF2SS1-6]
MSACSMLLNLWTQRMKRRPGRRRMPGNMGLQRLKIRRTRQRTKAEGEKTRTRTLTNEESGRNSAEQVHHHDSRRRGWKCRNERRLGSRGGCSPS